MGDWNPDQAQTVIAFAALLAAIAAGILSLKAYRTSYRPMVRVVPLTDTDDSGGTILEEHGIVLKNLGRGPAISITLVQGKGSSQRDLLGEIDALEPLGETYGPEFTESARVGRVEVSLERPLIDGQEYRVLYVDIAGGWHETNFKVLGVTFESRLAESKWKWQVPKWVRERSQIVTGLF